MNQRFLLVPVLSAVLGAAFATQAAAQPGRVTGLVKADGGQAVKGVTITAEHLDTGQTLTTTTDEKGRFLMIGLRTGLWTFVAQAPGFAPQGGDLFVRMGGPNPPIMFALQKHGAANFGALGGIASRDLQTELAAADALFTQSRWDEAIAAYRAVLTKAPPLTAINLQIALAYRNKKDFTSALGAYNELLKADPNNDKAKIGVSTLHLERGDAASARAALLPAAEAPEAGRELLFAVGELEAKTGNRADAVKWYERAAAADGSWGKPLYRLGTSAGQSGDKVAAAGFFNRVLVVDPASPEAELARSALNSLNK